MGIFSDNVEKYFDAGLICIPVGDKKQPILGQDWQLFCDRPPSDEMVSAWALNFHGCDKIGLCLGQASGLVAFDFDYAYDEKRVKIPKGQFEKDLKVIEAHILRILPPTPAIKVGKKGWTRFYKWSPALGARSNVSADRNGIRLFDFLSWHKQTIIPPSRHSVVDGSDLYYKWIGPNLLDCRDDIPHIDLAMVLEIRKIFGTGGNVVDNSRHGVLFSYLMKMAEVEPDQTKLVDMLIAKDIALFSIDPKGCYLSDKNHFRGGDKTANAGAWIDRVLSWRVAKRELGERSQAIDAESWAYFFEKQYPGVRKDILSKKVFIRRNENSDWTDMAAIEGVMRSRAVGAGLPKTHVTDELERYIFERLDETFLCDIPAWDGKDRVAEFGRCIVSPDFVGDEIGLILKHWGAGIFRRIYDGDAQNRCLILKGGQGLGKDSLVKAMFSGFKPYYEVTNLSGQPKDVFEIISRVFVLHLEEFEQTANLDVAFIKSIITQSSAFFRESYGRSPSRKLVAVTFVSTSNRDDILRDPTGNRRFIVVPVEKILWTYPRKESAQILAQLKAHFTAGEHEFLPDAIETKIKDIAERFTPPDPNETIVEMYEAMFDNFTIREQSLEFRGRKSMRGGDIQLGLREIARANEVSVKRVASILKAQKFSRREAIGTVYYRSRQGWFD